MWLSVKLSPAVLLAAAGAAGAAATNPQSSAPLLEIRDGYFWDPAKSGYFIPRGIAYQLWNPPVGANQSFEQLNYDLLEFKKMRANSVRCEMVWGELEIAEGVYDWSKPDYLVAEAERLGLRLFILIGFQYPPAWFPLELRGINSHGLTPARMKRLAESSASEAFQIFPAPIDSLLAEAAPGEFLIPAGEALVQGAKAGSVTEIASQLQSRLPPQTAEKVIDLLVSDVINYEHPEARAAYTRHLAAVTGRYKDRAVIGGWIMGNEYAYFDLWEDPKIFAIHRFLGYDEFSQKAFREYLSALYGADISALNDIWGTDYPDFASVVMPFEYPGDRESAAYHDLIQWRKRSIGDFIGAGAAAARQVDPGHLQSYSMVGGIFNGLDANYTCEDAAAIVAQCKEAGAPLDFWSLNNYANLALGSDLRSADFGVGKYQDQSGLPVMISETGHSSTEDLFDPHAGKRQPKAVPGQLWESVISGAIGTHLFHWNDRRQFQQGYFLRERGFGIVEQDRSIKPEVYTNVVNMFRRMEEVQLDRLLGGSANPPRDAQFFWSAHADMVWPRANVENAMLWGALKRAGYQVGILDDAAFESGASADAPILLLSRCHQMDPGHLRSILEDVIPAGIHVLANADLPGRYDRYHRPNPEWRGLMDSIFGLETANATKGLHGMATHHVYSGLELQGLAPLPPLPGPAYNPAIFTWNITHNISTTSGRPWVTHSGLQGSAPGTPALVTKSHSSGHGKSALVTFALGDMNGPSGASKEAAWGFRSEWIKAIGQSFFGVTPTIQLSGENAAHVIPDYRLCRDGSVLLSLLNEGTNTLSVTLAAPSLLNGRTVENLTQGGILELDSDGSIPIAMEGDDYVLLYAYRPDGESNSLIGPGPYPVWFESSPPVLHPRSAPYPIAMSFDTLGAGVTLNVLLESADGRPVAKAAPVTVSGKGRTMVELTVPDFDAGNPHYPSTAEGGRYFLRAWLVQGVERVGEVRIPVRLAWGVRPAAPLPRNPALGSTVSAEVEWREAPSPDPTDPTPFDRARLWESGISEDVYAVTLKLLDAAGNILSAAQKLTREGSGSATFDVAVPEVIGTRGLFDWVAELRPVTSLISHDVVEGFEGHERGGKWPDDMQTDFLAPWSSFTYSFAEGGGIDIWHNEGVQLSGAEGSQSAFLVITNPPNVELAVFGITHRFPGGPWALPENRDRWADWTFSFAFKEAKGLPCHLEMQVKNDDPDGTGKWIKFNTEYTPGPDGWARVEAPLSLFEAPPGMFGVFEPDKVAEIVLSIRMDQKGAQYVGAFDQIRFDGPDQILETGPAVAHYTSANDSAGFLFVTRDGLEHVEVSWTGEGRLQRAASLEDEWEFVPQVTNPLRASIEERQFYRLVR